MQLFHSSSRIIITCNKRLSPWLQQEVQELGFIPDRIFSTGIELKGTPEDCIRLNLNLRCASQVLFSLKAFEANTPDDIYRAVNTLPWETIIDEKGYISITSNVDHPSIRTPLFANVKVKDAIVDRMRDKTGNRPDSGADFDGAVIHLFWKDNRAELFYDTSGETLAKHGYRKIPGKAPMLEALAAATIMAGRWNRQSPFINPMCGSGTLAIEALLIATNRRPGLFRTNYSFMHAKTYNAGLYQQQMQLLEHKIKTPDNMQVVATDISEDAVRIAKINASLAGVDKYIHFDVCDFEETIVPEGAGGIVYFNPEYGERLGSITELEPVYKRIGDFMKKKCEGYTGYIFTGNLDLAKKIGLKPKRKIEFYTGKIDCRLMEYELYQGTRRVDV